jgi:protein subunit release factor A
MARLQTGKDRIQQLEDLERQEEEMEAKRRKLQQERGDRLNKIASLNFKDRAPFSNLRSGKHSP